MITQYPDSISIVLPDTYDQNVASGNFEKTDDGYIVTFDCRAEAGEPAQTGNADGIETANNWAIYAEPIAVILPLGVVIPIGAAYTLTRQGSIFTGKITGFKPNQLNTQLWG